VFLYGFEDDETDGANDGSFVCAFEWGLLDLFVVVFKIAFSVEA